MVVLAIIVIITAIAFTSQSSFNKSLILANTAYDVALTIRGAETYGIGSRAAGLAVNAGYGVNFSKASPGQFTLFSDTQGSGCHPVTGMPSDLPGNCVYDGVNERVTTYSLGNGITVKDFCAEQSSGSWDCATTGNTALSSLDIVFARPNPDPFISENGAYASSPGIIAACLTLSSTAGGARYVTVNASGAITANAVSCP